MHASLKRLAAAQPTPLLPRSAAAGGSSGAAAPQPGKRKLLSVSSLRLPGDAVPAHMMFGPASKAARLSDRPAGSNLTSGNHL